MSATGYTGNPPGSGGGGGPVAISDVTGLTAALAAKAALAHTHVESDVTSLVADLALKAPLASPTFTGTVAGISKTMVGLPNVDNTADTAKPVSTAQQTALDLKAALASPALTGNPTAPTQTAGNDSTRLATTAFVTAAVAAGGGGGGTSPIVVHAVVTSGNLTAAAHAGWTLLSGFTASIAASVGDEVEFVLTALFDLNASRTDKFELVNIVSGAIVRYASTGTSSPSAANDGDPAISNASVQFLGVTGLPMTITVESGDLDGGNVVFGIAHKGAGGGKVFADGATYPLRWRARNDH